MASISPTTWLQIAEEYVEEVVREWREAVSELGDRLAVLGPGILIAPEWAIGEMIMAIIATGQRIANIPLTSVLRAVAHAIPLPHAYSYRVVRVDTAMRYVLETIAEAGATANPPEYLQAFEAILHKVKLVKLLMTLFSWLPFNWVAKLVERLVKAILGLMGFTMRVSAAVIFLYLLLALGKEMASGSSPLLNQALSDQHPRKRQHVSINRRL